MSIAMLSKGLVGTKLGMTQLYEDNGDVVPCTLVEAGPCTVTQVKKADGPDKYEAIQIGFGDRREKLTSKPQAGHFKKAKVEPKRFLREVRLAPGAVGETKVGDALTCAIFAQGEYVDVIGTMKGRGFSGVVRRHGFATQKESHGAHYHWRHAGSIGCRKPEHTRRGTRMGGQFGNTRKTVQNLLVARVDAEKNLLYIRGAIPGPTGGMVMIRASKKRKAKVA
ncbi:MAG: 50S ribosomal protein L3 [Planctomycetota bacterium]